MSSAHLIFIPAAVFVGIILGFFIGTRAARDSFEMELKRREEREKVRSERAERKAKRKESTGKETEAKD